MSPGRPSFTSVCVLAAQQEEVPGLDRLPALADVELRAGRDAPLVHAEHRQAPDVGIDLDLEDVRQHVPARIGDRLQVGRLAAGGGNADVGGRVALGRVGQQLDDHLEQLGDAGAGLRRGEHHRDEVALAQRALERLVQLLGRDLAFLEVGLHQLLVDLDHLVDQLAVRLLYRGKVDLTRPASPEGAKKQSETLLRFAAGRLSGRHSLPKACWMRSSSASQVDVVGVDLVDDDQAVEAALRRPLHEARRHHLDAVLRVDHDRRGLDRGQRGQRMAEEVRVAGRVEQVDSGVLRIEAGDRELQRVLQLLFEGV